LTNTKRFGRYHNVTSKNSNYDKSSSQSHFSELASLYKGNNKKQLFGWNTPLFENKYPSSQKVLTNANKAIEKSTKFLIKMKSRRLACTNRAKTIPENATIRKEYIKCGKHICQQEHGPYYYAYWKNPESKKLKKKYIGNHMPKNKESNDDRKSKNLTP
jgi:hypothetical protein